MTADQNRTQNHRQRRNFGPVAPSAPPIGAIPVTPTVQLDTPPNTNRLLRHHRRYATTSEGAGTAAAPPPTLVSTRKRVYEAGGVGIGGHDRHQFRRAKRRTVRALSTHSSGRRSTAAATGNTQRRSDTRRDTTR